MSRWSMIAVVVGVQWAAAGSARAEDLVLGRDLPHINSEAGKEAKGGSVIIWSNGNSGCDVGFKIPDKYRGKNVKVTARVIVTQGQAQVGIDQFSVGLQESTDWYDTGKERSIVLNCKCPNTDKLYAVLRLDKDSKAQVLYIKIE